MTATSHLIRDYNYAGFREKFGKLAKRAVKLGVRVPVASIVERVEKQVGKDCLNRPVFGTYYRLGIDADPVKVEGFTFGATIDHNNEGGNVVRSMPGIAFDIPERFRSAASYCDHCKSLRARRYTYALRCDATGDFIQVGQNCMADFIGRDAADIARWADRVAECGGDNEDGYDGGYGLGADSDMDLLTTLQHTAAMIRVYGWVSAGAAKVDESLASTRSRVINNMYPAKRRDGTYEAVEPVTDGDKDLAAKAHAWALALASQGRLNEYLSNVLAVAKSTFIARRSLGIAASIVSAYQREVEKLAVARKEAVDTSGSVHVGAEKERLVFGKCRVLTAFSGESGGFFVHRYTFATPEGNVLRWSASSSQGLLKNQEVMLTGTVQNHDEWQGVKRTRINRCKVEPLKA